MFYVTPSAHMNSQVTDTLMMIRPAAFHLNEETAVNNYYQQGIDNLTESEVQEKALQEFDGFVEILRAAGITVHVFQDLKEENTPDSIFPNNWVSFHDDGRVLLYPMFAENRRKERKQRILDELAKNHTIKSISDRLLAWEKEGLYLEGTGSLILDRANKIAYAAISVRTDRRLLERFCKELGYKAVSFTANQTVGSNRLPIYHTNVMMCVGEEFALVCADSVDDPAERSNLIMTLTHSGKEIVLISERQSEQFAGNMLQVKNANEDRFVIMSEAAFQSLNKKQQEILSKHGTLLHASLQTIETLGGGSARCMMAEVFLPKH